MAVLVLTASSGFAAPLTDYSLGKTAIDLTVRRNDVGVKGPDYDLSFKKKYNMEWGATVGLGSNFAFQYSGFNADSKDITHQGVTGHGKLRGHEFNVLYQLAKTDKASVSAFLGAATNKWSITTAGDGTSSTKNKTRFQIGALGTVNLSSKTMAYTSIGLGSKLVNWKIGVSQQVAKNLELNLDYRYYKAKDLTGNDFSDEVDVTNKGIGLGLTFKF